MILVNAYYSYFIYTLKINTNDVDFYTRDQVLASFLNA